MNDKRMQWIEAAMRCFSRKGFRSTSIQEIADELGMAKGSIYFYFKSKDELFLAVISRFGERVSAGMTTLPDERRLPPRERFRLQLRRHFGSVAEHREFMLMLMREPFALEDQPTRLHELLNGMRARFLRWLRQHVDDIHGERARAYAGDAAALFSGMMMEYTRMLVLGNPAPDANRLASFLAARLDDLVEGMVRSGERPVLNRDYASPEGEEGEPDREELALGLVRELKELAERETAVVPGDGGAREELLSALGALEERIREPAPDRLVRRSLLSYVKELTPPAWHPVCERLADAVGALD